MVASLAAAFEQKWACGSSAAAPTEKLSLCSFVGLALLPSACIYLYSYSVCINSICYILVFKANKKKVILLFEKWLAFRLSFSCFLVRLQMCCLLHTLLIILPVVSLVTVLFELFLFNHSYCYKLQVGCWQHFFFQFIHLFLFRGHWLCERGLAGVGFLGAYNGVNWLPMFVYKLLTFSTYYDLLKKKNMKPSGSVVVGLGFHLRCCSIPNLGLCVSVWDRKSVV